MELIVELVGIIGILALVIWRLVKYVNLTTSNRLADFRENDFKHIKGNLDQLNVTVARMDERLKAAEGDIKVLFQKLNHYFNNGRAG